MKVGTSRFVVVAVITGLLLIAGSTAAWAQSPNFTPDFSANPGSMSLNGNTNGLPTFFNPGEGPTVLRLTPSAGNRVGSAWFNVQQPVKDGFTTTFKFQITAPSGVPGDGIAFVIQNDPRGTGAIGYTGGNGGALGYGDQDASSNPSTGEGIANSVAIEFDTYQNGWDPDANHIAVQSCGTGNNTSHHNVSCGGGGPTTSTLGIFSVAAPTFSDGNPHTVTITYTPCADCAAPGLNITLDSNPSVFVAVNLSTLLHLTNGDAYVGFTASTGGSVETQDIVSWTYQAQVAPDQTTTFNFPNNNYVVTPTGDQSPTVQVLPVLKSQNDCNALVDANTAAFVTPALTAQCFVYKNADGLGNDRSVMYEVTCPSLGGMCSPFDADLGSTYDLPTASGSNPGFNPSNPFPGWLKGDGGTAGHPCVPPASGPLFVSNQVSFFDLSATDPFTKGKSGGTGSCWVATYNTPHEAPTVTITTPANGGNYAQGSTVNANYACAAVNAGATSSTGPYLTVPPTTGCTGTVANGSPIDTTATGPHTFTASVLDSATDNASSTVTYNVVAPADLAILNLAAPRAPVNSTLTYAIGVGDLGGATAVGVMVTDTFPTGLTPLSASGSNISCAVVNRRLTCTTTPFTCSVAAQTVTCPVGPIAPLSWSALNGATIQIKAKVIAATGTVLKDTATVSSSNADSKLSNNSSTATTTVTAH